MEGPRTTPIKQSRRVEDDRDAPADAKRVLLVIEDDDTFAAILRVLSREMGFRSLVAGTAEEALSLAKQFMPSAIVLMSVCQTSLASRSSTDLNVTSKHAIFPFISSQRLIMPRPPFPCAPLDMRSSP